MDVRARALAAGVGALALAAAILVALARLAADGSAAPALAQLGIHLAAGREASIPAGQFAGLTWQASFLLALALEWSMLLAAFCALELAGARLRAWPPARERLARAHAWLEGRERVGILALGALTLFPFLPVGAITALLVGEALALPAVPLLFVLLAAELAANLAVALAAASAAAILPDPAWGLAAMVALALLAGAWLARRGRA